MGRGAVVRRAQRGYVEQVAEELKARGVRCFYDADEQVELWGKYLAEELPAIYGEQAAAAVVFISAEYAAGRLDPARAPGRTRPGRCANGGSTCCRPGSTTRHFLGCCRTWSYHRPAHRDSAAVRRHDRRQARHPRHHRAGHRSDAGSAKVEEANRPAGAVRVGEADPRRLGVHAAISVPEIPDEGPLEYVPRDADSGRSGRAGPGRGRGRAGRIRAAGRRVLGRQDPAARSRPSAALLPDWWSSAPGRAGRGRRRWPGRAVPTPWCGLMSCSATWTASYGLTAA